ncbi:MAG: hypothetical protein QW613_00045 [Thermoprotei archaeon]
MDYELGFERLRRATLTLISKAIEQAMNTQFNLTENGRKVIYLLDPLEPNKLRSLAGKHSVTLGATDGSYSVEVFGDTVFISVAAASLIYEMGFTGSVWIEKWPGHEIEYSLVLPLLAHQIDAMVSDSTLYFETMASNIMKLLEYMAMVDTMNIADIIIGDGSLSMDYKMSVNLSINQKLYAKTNLAGLQTKLGELDEYDLFINLFRTVYSPADRLNPYTLIFQAESNNGKTTLDKTDASTLAQLQTLADTYPTKIRVEHGALTLSEEAMKSWDKLVEVLNLLRQNITQAPHPLILQGRQLALDDISLLRSYAYIQLLLSAKHSGKLLISVAKDSSSTSLQELISSERSQTNKKFSLPDKLALEVYSGLKHPDLLTRPWRTLEYDPLSGLNPADSGQTMREIFSRFYVQLVVDERIRSDVMVCERLKRSLPTVTPTNPQTTDPDFEYTLGVLLALSQQTNSIPEAIGHIYPLFEVDKYVKHVVRQLSGMLKSYQALLTTDPAYREYLSIIKPFRQKRSEFERGRRSWVQNH